MLFRLFFREQTSRRCMVQIWMRTCRTSCFGWCGGVVLAACSRTLPGQERLSTTVAVVCRTTRQQPWSTSWPRLWISAVDASSTWPASTARWTCCSGYFFLRLEGWFVEALANPLGEVGVRLSRYLAGANHAS